MADALLAWGRSGRTIAAKIECAHRRARKLLTDYKQNILTVHSIYDYFALLCFKHKYHLIFINISKTNYLLINHLICTTPDTEEIVILILHYLIIQKLKNVICTKLFIWNSLPNLLKNCTSKLAFEKQIKSHLLASQS